MGDNEKNGGIIHIIVDRDTLVCSMRIGRRLSLFLFHVILVGEHHFFQLDAILRSIIVH